MKLIVGLVGVSEVMIRVMIVLMIDLSSRKIYRCGVWCR